MYRSASFFRRSPLALGRWLPTFRAMAISSPLKNSHSRTISRRMPAHVGAGVPANINKHRGLSPRSYDVALGRSNHLYSVAALTNSAGGVVERYRYDTFGNRTILAPDEITTRAVSSYNQQIGFTGRYLDKETGLWYFRARYYLESLGRFIGRDPLGYVDGYHMYRAGFSPNTLDPEGTKKIKLKFGAFIPKSFGMDIINNPTPGINYLVTPDPINDFSSRLKTMTGTDNREAPGSDGTNRVKTFTIRDIEGSKIGKLEPEGVLTQDASDASHQLIGVRDIKWTSWFIFTNVYTYLNRSLQERTADPYRYYEKVKDVSPCESHITVRVKGTYPFTDHTIGIAAITPSIDYEVTWKLKRSENDTKFEIASNGQVNEFPAYENVVNGTLIWGQPPTASGPGVFSLGVFTDNFDVPWRDIP